MSAGSKLTGLLIAGVLCLPVAAAADTPTPHRAHKVKKQPPPPPLPSGTQGPVPQVPLDSIPAVPPQVTYQDGMLTIVAPNSTLGDILRGVRKHTSADIEIPAAATERVATHLGPGPARQVVAELLNGSHFNYILLGSPDNADLLVRAVLVAKTPDTPAPNTQAANGTAAQSSPPATATEAVDAPDEPAEEPMMEQTAAEAEQQQETPPDQPGVKTPQQMLQEMQQRQIQMQQQQQQPGQQAAQPFQPGQQPPYPPPGMPRPQMPVQTQQNPPEPQ